MGDKAQEPEQVARNAARVKDGFWAKLKRVARRVPFAHDLVAAYFCAMDPATPVRVRATLLGALAYFVLPLDSIPDFLFGFGFTDDATVLLAALSLVAASIKPSHRQAAEDALAETLELRPEPDTDDASDNR
ncbi:MAG: YkvA family protein [Pseudomonadota bacterium]